MNSHVLPEHFVLQAVLVGLGIFVLMLVSQAIGRRMGMRHLMDDAGFDKGIGAAEGAVYGILGLFLAFAFSGAGARFDERRHLIIDEANAIGTAWLRIDLLPDADRPALRQMFRDYLDARIETYEKVPDMAAVYAANDRAVSLQGRIWSLADSACARAGQVPPFTLMLPALNEMFDIASTRSAVTRIHPPVIVLFVIAILAVVASLFAGYASAGRKRASRLHSIGFAAVIAGAIFVTLNLEYPRLGLIRVDAMDQVLVDLRQSMR